MSDAYFDLNLVAEKKKLLGIFQQRSIISGFTKSVIDSKLENSFGSQQSNKPSWYDDLVIHFDQTLSESLHWHDTVAPSIGNVLIPYIDFSRTFDGHFEQFSSLLTKVINDADADVDHTVNFMEAIIARWITSVRQHASDASALQDKTQSFSKDLKRAIKGLTEGAQSVNNDLETERDAVKDVTDQIAQLHSKLQSDINSAIAADAATLVGFVGAIVTIVVTIANPLAGAVAGAVVVGLDVIVDAVGTTITSIEIVNDQNEIIEKQKELSNDSQQVVVLNSLALTVNGLLDTVQNDNFQLGLAQVEATWVTLEDNLKAIDAKLVGGRTDTEALKRVLTDLQDFQKTLHEVKVFCTEIQSGAGFGNFRAKQLLISSENS